MRSVIGVLAMVCGLFWMTNALAEVRIDIDLSRQSMDVSSDRGHFTWPVSTARSGYVTPHGSSAPYSLQRMHYSHKYHMSPMPYSIFFAGGYAIHGTYSVAQLGRPASHGCIRLSPGHAAALFKMVQDEGATISISGTPPHSTMFAKAHRRDMNRFAGLHEAYSPHRHAAGQNAGRGLAYAPARAVFGSIRTWQSNPFYRW